MATNRELRETAEALAQEVGVSVSVDGLGRKKLEELIESLEARKAPAPEGATPSPGASDATESAEQAPADESPAPPDSAASISWRSDGIGAFVDRDRSDRKEPSGPARYVVAPGVSYCCSKRGTIAPGQTITAADFGGDVEALHRQVVAGKIRKV